MTTGGVMRKGLIFAICAVVIFAATARAEESIPLYKDFSFGQGKASIKKELDFEPCGDQQNDLLCRQKQTFAGFTDWEQVLVFLQGKLVTVALGGPLNESRYTKTLGAILNNGFVPSVLQTPDRQFDLLATAKAKGGKAAAAEMSTFESVAMNGGQLVYTFIPKETLQAGKKSESFLELLRTAPLSIRAVEMELTQEEGEPVIYVRFIAPKAALAIAREEMKGQTDKF